MSYACIFDSWHEENRVARLTWLMEHDLLKYLKNRGIFGIEYLDFDREEDLLAYKIKFGEFT
jgi:hypothetical protein